MGRAKYLKDRQIMGGALTPVVVVGSTADGAVQVDEVQSALLTINVDHHEVHEGEMFVATYKSPDDSPVADDGTLVFSLDPGDKVCHLVYKAACGGDAEIELRENVDVEAGSGFTPINMNRLSANVSDTTVLLNPTINDAGDLLENSFIAGGGAILSQGGEATIRPDAEWMLNPNRVYLIRLTNRSGTAQPMSIFVQWYEEDLA